MWFALKTSDMLLGGAAAPAPESEKMPSPPREAAPPSHEAPRPARRAVTKATARASSSGAKRKKSRSKR
jgi:hypothetical protein